MWTFGGEDSVIVRASLRFFECSRCAVAEVYPFSFDRSVALGCKSDDGVTISSDRNQINSIPHPCDSAISGSSVGFSGEERQAALDHFEEFHRLPKGSANIGQVSSSPGGIKAWHSLDPKALVKVCSEVHPVALCGLWARKAISAVADHPEWERVVFTVDSGASEAVVPPSVGRNLPLLHSVHFGTEYEVANGGIIVDLGEKRAEIVTKPGSKNLMAMSFQVVEVHKPLLAVSRLVEAGRRVNFDKADPHILLASGEKLPIICREGTYEVEIWIKNPSFTRPSGR